MQKIYETPTPMHDERGQTMAEYAVVLGVISVGVLLAIGAFSATLSIPITRVSELLIP